MKYYIATSLSNAKAHNYVQDLLNQGGHELIYDWTVHGSVKSEGAKRLEEVALLELNAIEEADFVVVLLPGGKGTHVELGFSIASGKQVFLHSNDASVFEGSEKTCAFYFHPTIHRSTVPLDQMAQFILTQVETQLVQESIKK